MRDDAGMPVTPAINRSPLRIVMTFDVNVASPGSAVNSHRFMLSGSCPFALPGMTCPTYHETVAALAPTGSANADNSRTIHWRPGCGPKKSLMSNAAAVFTICWKGLLLACAASRACSSSNCRFKLPLRVSMATPSCANRWSPGLSVGMSCVDSGSSVISVIPCLRKLTVTPQHIKAHSDEHEPQHDTKQRQRGLFVAERAHLGFADWYSVFCLVHCGHPLYDLVNCVFTNTDTVDATPDRLRGDTSNARFGRVNGCSCTVVFNARLTVSIAPAMPA